MAKQHNYSSTLTWTGNTGEGTVSYRSYERSYTISIENKAIIEGSSDPNFRGDRTKHNPEEMLLMSLSSCHMLWFLHFCSEAGVNVVAYTDVTSALMVEEANGSGYFTEATLKPHVVVSNESMLAQLDELHHKANKYCFIANSVKFPIKHEGMGEVKT
ncbi:OsmC family protein [Mucilaginibacter terrae]|uniref:Organic hydroperoxide reductase OsmC/OhrA n=1 Tax=Mucilaginibacter terrae TaxID=1955052 RepID=A0ABU3GTQ6_9SPHI|nr:OsmC family protein [Mucilaginibacter terrae]MDT3403163.1 organic hydroperoxide reductase OsmC/OhrA [Mucilaginibacter terrae]